MNNRGMKDLIEFIGSSCWTTLTPKQTEQLREMRNMARYNIYKFRILYRIAIDNHVYPECPYCKKPITTQEEFTVDHITPRSKGGTDDIENLQPMHKICNSDKGCAEPEKTTCDEVPVKKHRKPHNSNKHKEREIVKSRTPEELYQKCRRIDQARTSRTHANVRGYSK